MKGITMSNAPVPTSSTLPPETFGLGDPVSTHAGGHGLRTGLIVLGIGLVLSCGALLMYFTIGVPQIIAIGAPIAALVGVVMAVQGFFQRGQKAVVFADGVAEIKGGKTNIMRWDDISSVWQSITVTKMYGVVETGRRYIYTVQASDGRRMVFGNTYKNVEALGKAIQQAVTSRLMPRYFDAFNGGGTVKFGSLTLSKAGLSNGRETIPWNEVEQVTLNRGTITVRKAGKWLGWTSQTAAQTPNLFIFLTMIDRIVGLNKPKKAPTPST